MGTVLAELERMSLSSDDTVPRPSPSFRSIPLDELNELRRWERGESPAPRYSPDLAATCQTKNAVQRAQRLLLEEQRSLGQKVDDLHANAADQIMEDMRSVESKIRDRASAGNLRIAACDALTRTRSAQISLLELLDQTRRHLDRAHAYRLNALVQFANAAELLAQAGRPSATRRLVDQIWQIHECASQTEYDATKTLYDELDHTDKAIGTAGVRELATQFANAQGRAAQKAHHQVSTVLQKLLPHPECSGDNVAAAAALAHGIGRRKNAASALVAAIAHTFAFAAVCRGAGIPTRMAVKTVSTFASNVHTELGELEGDVLEALKLGT